MNEHNTSPARYRATLEAQLRIARAVAVAHGPRSQKHKAAKAHAERLAATLAAL